MSIINNDFNYNLKEFIVRPPTTADIEAMVTLANMCAKSWQSDNVITLEQFQVIWSSPNFNPELNIRLVTTQTGLIGGVFLVVARPPYINIFWRGDVHPGDRRHHPGRSETGHPRCQAGLPAARQGPRVGLDLWQRIPCHGSAGRQTLGHCSVNRGRSA